MLRARATRRWAGLSAAAVAATALVGSVVATTGSAGTPVEGTLSAQPPEEVLDHFKCYKVLPPAQAGAVVFLEDQFGAGETRVDESELLCNPVEKQHAGSLFPIRDPEAHLVCYRTLDLPPPRTAPAQVRVTNQFGDAAVLVVGQAVQLCVPSAKSEGGPPGPIPATVDHFRCYEVSGQPPATVVVLRDQFGGPEPTPVNEPVALCNPARKTHAGQVFPPRHPEAHLVCYSIEPRPVGRSIFTNDQFLGERPRFVEEANRLCVPSKKEIIVPPPPPPPVDHFKCYDVTTQGGKPFTVGLRDQFGAGEVRVHRAVDLCNPVEKRRPSGEVTPITRPEGHLKCYRIKDPQQTDRLVETQDQFGVRKLRVLDARALCLPAGKSEEAQQTEIPKGVDHYKCYAVEAQEDVAPEPVVLRDQFHEEDTAAIRPVALCNPVEKRHAGRVFTPEHPDVHLVCYELKKTKFDKRTVFATSQFGFEELKVQRPAALCLPAEKRVVTG